MAGLGEQLASRAARVVCRNGAVRAVHDLGPAFRRVDVEIGEVSWAPGSKVQFRIRGATFRTFTPFGWGDGTVSFLVHRHDRGPATSWVDGLEAGGEVQLFGPRRSLSLSNLETGPILVGDETSFALAAAWAAHGPHPATAHVFEVTSHEASETVLEHLGVGRSMLVERTAGDEHHGQLAERVLGVFAGHPTGAVMLTGKAQTIRAVRGALKDAGLAPAVRVKAYWDPNRSGLD